jgi:ATP-dependent DNA helicase RecG
MPITDDLLLKAAEIGVDGSLLPQPVVELEERTLDGCRLLVIQVHPHGSPPVRLRGRVFVRIGPRNHQASIEHERILNERRRGRDLPFDHRPSSDATLADVDELKFRESYVRSAISADVLAENQRTDQERMLSLRLVDPNGVPTIGGLLIVGKDPERFIPGAYVEYVRFAGSELSDPISDTKRISGTLDDQLAAIDDILKLSIRTAIDVTAGDREERAADYPIVALQQLVRNAIMHRNYETSNAPVRIYWFEDRVEVHNPGGLFGQVNKDNFGTGVTDYRNPLIAEGMKVYGFVQRFGVGIQLSKKALRENGNPQPEFQFGEFSFAVIIGIRR